MFLVTKPRNARELDHRIDERIDTEQGPIHILRNMNTLNPQCFYPGNRGSSYLDTDNVQAELGSVRSSACGEENGIERFFPQQFLGLGIYEGYLQLAISNLQSSESRVR